MVKEQMIWKFELKLKIIIMKIVDDEEWNIQVLPKLEKFKTAVVKCNLECSLIQITWLWMSKSIK